MTTDQSFDDNRFRDQDPQNDWTWFALDHDGLVGSFATLNSAPVHRIGRDFVYSHRNILLPYFESLPADTDADININFRLLGATADEVVTMARFGGWTELAERGTHAFSALEYDSFPKPYVWVARPRVALTVDRLRPDIASIMRQIVIGGISFKAAENIRLDEL